MSAKPSNALGIDIGGTHTRLGIVEPGGRVVEFREHPTPAAGDPSELSGLIKQTIEAWSSKHELGNAAVGVALPGIWDRATTIMQRALNLPRLDGVRLDELFEHAVGRSVYLETDVIAAGWAQHRALDPSPARFAYLSIGTGVGGCVILDGQIVRHTRGGAGHFGHLIVDTSPNAPRCRCGGRGCLEALVAGAAWKTSAAQNTRSVDGEASATVARGARALAVAASQISAIYAPDVIVVGGGVAEGIPDLIEQADQHFHRSASGLVRAHPPIRPAPTPSAQAGIIGAALLAADESPD